MADSVKIRITGDDSGFRKTLSGLGSATTAIVKGFAVASAAASALWGAVGAVGISYNANIEQLQTSFEVMTGSATEAADVLDRIRTLGASTPFETEGLASTVQLLMNYGLGADSAISKMTQLGDIAQGNQDKLTRIATAYGQMSSAGKVSLEDIKQMIEAGFNPLQEISQSTGESMASLYDRISKGTLAIDEITASMERSTSAGGKYYQSMEKQSKTLLGQLSTLKDNASQLLGDIMGSASDGISHTLLPMAIDMVGELADAFRAGGIDGLIEAATAKIPMLLDGALSALKSFIPKITAWLPSAIRQIASVIPSLVRGLVDMAPQIVTALFEIVSSLVSDLITMLPELVPMLVQGVGKMLLSVVTGVGKIINSIFDGLQTILLPGKKKTEEAINSIFDDVDRDRVEELKASVNISIDTEVSTDDYTTEITTAVNEIKSTLAGITSLSDDERTAILNAIINGTGIDLLGSAFDEAFPGVDTTPITTAMNDINTALEGLELTQDAKDHIAEVALAGGDVEAALISYGVDPQTAKDTAATITDSMGTINTAAASLGIGPTTLATVLLGAFNDQKALVAALKLMGLTDTDIESVLASYDTVSGSLTAKVFGIYADIATVFTDGVDDTNEDVVNAKAAVQGWADDAYAKIDEWYAARLTELEQSGMTGQELKDAVAEAKEQYDSMYREVDNIVDASGAYVEDVAGKSTEYVKGKLDELDEIQSRAEELSARLDILTNEAFDAVRSRRDRMQRGITLTQEQQTEVLGYTYKEYKGNVASAESTRDSGYSDLEDRASRYEYSDQQYQNEAAKIEADYKKRLATAESTYNNEMRQNIIGMMKGSPELLAKYGKTADMLGTQEMVETLRQQMNDAFDESYNTGEPIDLSKFFENVDASGVDLAKIAEAAGITPEELQTYITNDLNSGLVGGLSTDVLNNAADTLATGLNTAMGEIGPSDFGDSADVLQAAIENGYLVDGVGGIDWANYNTLFYTMLEGMAGSGVQAISDKEPEAVSAAESIASSVTTAMDANDEMQPSGVSSADGWVTGWLSRVIAMKKAVQDAARKLPTWFNEAQDAHSPARLWFQPGRWSGQGWEGGFTNSINEAIRRLPRTMNNLIGAANLPFRASFADVSQSITSALASTNAGDATIGLYVNGKRLADVTVDDTRRAQNARIRRLALGVGK